MSGAYGGAAYGGAAYMPVTTQSSFNGTMPYSVITEIAFASNPLDDATAVWTDVSQYVQSVETHRGRQHELNRFEAGTATVTLKNLDGRFSPFNTSSPYNPNVLPYKQIRVRALYNGVYYPIFRGHINSWPVKWPSPADSTVTVQATDATKILNILTAKQLSPTYKSTILADSPTVLYMLDDVGGSTVALDSSGNANHGSALGTSSGAFFGAASLLTADASTSFDCGATNANALVSPPGIITCPSNITLNSANDWSIEAWIYPRSIPGVGRNAIMQALNGSQNFQLTFNADQTLTAQVSDGTTTLTAQTSSKMLLNQPNFIAVGWVHSTKNLQVLVSGVQDVTQTNSVGAFNVGGSGNQALAFGNVPGLYQAIAIWTTVNINNSATIFPAYHYFAGTSPQFASKAFGSITGYQTTGTRIGKILDAVGWPSTLRKVDAGLVTVQPGSNDLVKNTALANVQATADTELGDLFVGADGSVVFYDHLHKYKTPNGLPAVVLGDSGTTGPGGESPYLLDSVDIEFDDLDIYNQASVTPANQGAQIVGDSTSQTAYGIRSLSQSGIHQVSTDAANEANWLVGKYKAPLQRIRSVTFQPLSDPTVLLPAAMGFELLTRVNVKRRPKDGASSTFAQDSLIEGVSHKITAGYWETTWALSPTDANPPMGIFSDPGPAGLFGTAVFGF